ncbi:MAG: hypothetical protein R3253_01070 [Longimicrobiales bacterium]|nr:hypothetical protein [Longimicrobiales bacterium]
MKQIVAVGPTLALATLLAVASGLPHLASEAEAQKQELGTISFPNSGSRAAQGPFIEGVLLLHSFEFDDAAQAFRRAQQIDPDFAMAYWGEAMTYNHPLWREQDREAALATLRRFAPSPDQRLAKVPTPREKDYFRAIHTLYGEGTKTERDRAYMAQMFRLVNSYPDDLEARAFYALSILGSTNGERDFATYMRAAAAAQPVFDKNPDHPGAAHYIIHSFDDPIHAPLGLEAARAYSEIAPDAAHAQHMTSHIFVAMGMWDDVIDANVRARDVQNAQLAARGQEPNVCGHYTSWLHYGWLMRGDVEDAERGMGDCHARVAGGSATPSEVGYFTNMRARHVLDTEDWSAAQRFSADLDRPGYRFVSAYAAMKEGRHAEADAIVADLRADLGSDAPPRAKIMLAELEALQAVHAGSGDQALRLLREAAATEEELPFEFGPPASLKPPHELLGEVALELGRHDIAYNAFQKALEFTPQRVPSLQGLAAAARAAGRTAMAADAESRLERIRRGSH